MYATLPGRLTVGRLFLAQKIGVRFPAGQHKLRISIQVAVLFFYYQYFLEVLIFY